MRFKFYVASGKAMDGVFGDRVKPELKKDTYNIWLKDGIEEAKLKYPEAFDFKIAEKYSCIMNDRGFEFIEFSKMVPVNYIEFKDLEDIMQFIRDNKTPLIVDDDSITFYDDYVE